MNHFSFVYVFFLIFSALWIMFIYTNCGKLLFYVINQLISWCEYEMETATTRITTKKIYRKRKCIIKEQETCYHIEMIYVSTPHYGLLFGSTYHQLTSGNSHFFFFFCVLITKWYFLIMIFFFLLKSFI